MKKYDAIVAGGGFGGLVAAALLAKLGKKVILLERESDLGGRVRSVHYEGYTINMGPHLIEDSGSGLCKIYEFFGKKIEVGVISDAMPVWTGTEWRPVGERYKGNKEELKSLIRELINTDYAEFDKYDHLPLRAWLLERKASQGVIDLFEFVAMLEQLTDEWYDHSASENLYVRKMHYQEKGMAGYSFWPKDGYEKLFAELKEVITQHQGVVRMETEVSRVLIDKGKVEGVLVRRRHKDLFNESVEEEVLESPIVISTLPVWTVLNIVPAESLPEWYVDLIRNIAQEKHKACWIGVWAASEKQIFAKSEKELTAWFKTPRTGLAGFSYSASSYDPSVAPAGKHLFTCGFACKAEQISNRAWLSKMFQNIEADLEEMFPAFKKTLWRKRYTVFEPAFGILGKPGLCGSFRPDFVAPNIEGLYFVSDTFRGRGIGIDKVARTALSCVERIQGKKIPFFENSWRY